MKKLFIISLLFTLLYSVKLNAYSTTGHDLFSEITFIDDGSLLVDISSIELDAGYKDMGRAKFMGWKHHYLTIKAEATYVGEILFAKSNRSRDPIKIDYKFKETDTNERSVTYAGSLSGKFKAKIYSIDSEINAKYDKTVKKVTSKQTVQETSFVIIVYPGYKLLLRETGECLVTNGLSKYYFFGITMNKGHWEYIDIITKYYEIYEERVDVWNKRLLLA